MEYHALETVYSQTLSEFYTYSLINMLNLDTVFLCYPLHFQGFSN